MTQMSLLNLLLEAATKRCCGGGDTRCTPSSPFTQRAWVHVIEYLLHDLEDQASSPLYDLAPFPPSFPSVSSTGDTQED
jgi:hypothetical protein